MSELGAVAERPGRVSTRRVVVAVSAVVVLAAVLAVAVPRMGRSPGGGAGDVSTASNPDLVRLEAQVVDRPEDADAWSALGAAYVDHARVNSDPSAYPKAERALERALSLAPDGWQALAASGALAAGRHDFGTAIGFLERARALQPQNAFILGVLVDTLTELGRYDDAVATAQEMVDLRPELASYARVSYQRELHGDVPGAIDAMRLALRASGSPGDRAFSLYHLGLLEWERGSVDAAEGFWQSALGADPTAAQAQAGLGRVAVARGDVAAAIGLYEKAVTAFPDPELLKELGELYLVAGDEAAAEARFARSAESNAAQAAGGVYVDLEHALFSADHNRDLAGGLAAAEREWSRRQSVHVADALAWQLHRNGRSVEALPHADRALALGMRNAMFHFHRAEIHRAVGNRSAALADYQTALSINPHFSFLLSDDARLAVSELSR